MEKKYAIYTQTEDGTRHSVITELTADEAAGFIKMILTKMDPNNPVDISVHPYIKL